MKTLISSSRSIIPVTITTDLHTCNSCPNCQSPKFKKAGIDNQTQRYKCKKCGKNFRSTTNSNIRKLHKKHLIETYIQCMNQSLSLRKTAQLTGISLSTAFRWRHKFLSNNIQIPIQEKTYSAASLTLPYSEKGNRKTSVKTIKSQSSLLILGSMGNLSLQTLPYKSKHYSILINLSGMIAQNLNPPITLSASNPNHSKRQITEAMLELQNQAEQWLGKFRGVASKYLQHYWNWFVSAQRYSNIVIHQALANYILS